MNDWSLLEQKNAGQPKNESGDQILRSTERAPDAQHTADAKDTHVTKRMDDREQVEHTADRIRDELLLTLEELDRRRHQALNVRYQASQHKDLIVGVAITAAVLVGVGVGVAVWRARHREQILASHRMKAVKRAWTHPDRVASTARQRPLAVEMGRKLIMIFGSALASSIAKNAVQGLVPQKRTEPVKG